ncbi:MAG: hypothetical protein ACE5HI_09340 [bacterium]
MKISLHIDLSNEDLFNEIKAAFDNNNISYNEYQIMDTAEAEGTSAYGVTELIIKLSPLAIAVITNITLIIRELIKNRKPPEPPAINHFEFHIDNRIFPIVRSEDIDDVDDFIDKKDQ